MRCFLIALGLLASFTPALAQQPRAVPQTRTEAILSFSPVVKRVAPAVVNVYASRTETVQANPLFNDPFFRQFFGGQGAPSRGRTEQSLGSGVIIDASGLVVTNHHVIENMTEVKVALTDKREFEADIVLRDPRTDLAVLKLKGPGPFPVLDTGDSDALEVGDMVLALGNPFGVGQTVTQGIISALARTQVGISDYGFFIQTDAAINPGNSGGALVDMNGRLVGINSAIFSQSGGSVGIGFAIPVNMVKVVVAAARGGGRQVRRPWLGASLQGVTKDIAEGVGLDHAGGALVSDLVGNGPLADAGARRGDVIVSVDNQPVDDPEGLGYRIATHVVGGTASIGLMRDGKPVTVAMRLIAAPETPPRNPITPSGRNPFAGATIVNVSPAVSEELSLHDAKDGVVIAAVGDNSMAGQLGLQKGDLILAINDTKIASTGDLEKALNGRRSYWKLTLGRNGQVLTTVLGG